MHTLGNNRILRTGDACPGPVSKPEIEDLLRATLITVVHSEFEVDVAGVANSQPDRRIVDIFNADIPEFSKYRLAKAYLRWTRDHDAQDLTDDERRAWKALITRINKALR